MTLSAHPMLIGDAIAAIHKTLRAEVFALSEQLAKAPTDAVALLQTMQQVRYQILTQESQTGPLIESALRHYDPALANQLEDNCLKLEAQLDHLCAQARLEVPGQPVRHQTRLAGFVP